VTAIAAEERLDTMRKLITKRIVTLFQRTDFIWLGEALRSHHDVAHRTTPASVFSLCTFPVLISKAKRSVNFP
jgi:hypothetical protein